MKLIFTGIFLIVIWTWVFFVYAKPQLLNNDTTPTQLDTIKQENTKKDTVPKPALYTNISFTTEQTLKASGGTKSVVFNTAGTKLYAMNLEGLNVQEFDQSTKALNRTFQFKPTKGIGWDYQTKKATISWQEKPVEACFSNNDSILWVSLHNANGVVPIKVFDNNKLPFVVDSSNFKIIKQIQADKSITKLEVPLIKTGSTPKVVEVANGGKQLLVSNWHAKTVSVLNINSTQFPYANLIKDVAVTSIPRGIVVDDALQKSYIAIMGSNTIAVMNNNTWVIEKYLPVLSNPRHVLEGEQNTLVVSFNSLNKVAMIDKNTGAVVDSISTKAQPRSMALSNNKQFLFVTCYNGNTVDVFKLTNHKFTPLYSLPCKGKPVGIDLYENDTTIEAWVCNYVAGNIKVFSFSKN
ncbi:MAG: YncE family protein [Chitinophagaceae bacterium]